MNLSLLIISCDRNIDQLNLICDSLDQNWKNCQLKRFIGIENSKFEREGYVSLLSSKLSWSSRVKEYLEKINTDYVLIVLDDFYIEEKVNEDILLQLYEYIENDQLIANITLANINDLRNERINSYLCKRQNDANYLVNMQIGLWRTKILNSLLRENENPWQVELYGSIRARKFSNCKFCCLNSDAFMPFKYGRGWLVVRGFWNLDEIERLKIENNKYILKSKKERKRFSKEVVLVPRYKRIREIIGIRYRKFLSLFSIYI